MNIFFEKVARSRTSYICNRNSKANNKYLKTYDQREELKHIIYLDTNIYMVIQYQNFVQQVDSNG